MDFRQGSFIYWTTVFVASVVGRSYTGEDKNAGWPCVLCTEEGRQGWQVV